MSVPLIAWLISLPGIFITGYAVGRSRPFARLDRRTWRRLTFGPARGESPVGWRDAVAYCATHPWRGLRAVLGIPKWSPFHPKPSAPRPSIDALDLMPKGRPMTADRKASESA